MTRERSSFYLFEYLLSSNLRGFQSHFDSRNVVKKTRSNDSGKDVVRGTVKLLPFSRQFDSVTFLSVGFCLLTYKFLGCIPYAIVKPLNKKMTLSSSLRLFISL